MAPSRKKGHAWTRFELHTMLCLILKGVHLEDSSKKSSSSSSGSSPGSRAQMHAYENFATQLNLALHGKCYSQDIPKEEVIGMLEKLLHDRKHVVGKDRLSLYSRSRNGRVTRGMVLAFGRAVGLNFHGSKAEWAAGRGERVMGEARKVEEELKAKRAKESRAWRR